MIKNEKIILPQIENMAEGCWPGEIEVFSDFDEIDKVAELTHENVG